MTKTPHWLDHSFPILGYLGDEPSLRMLIEQHYRRHLEPDRAEACIAAFIQGLDDNPLVTALHSLLADVENGVDFGKPFEDPDNTFHESVMAARGALGIERERRIILTDLDRAMTVKWTPYHAELANQRGWCLADYDGSGALQLQKCDDMSTFKSDAEAIAQVMTMAYLGDQQDRDLAVLALKLDHYFERIIYGKDYVSKIHGCPLNYTGPELRPDSHQRQLGQFTM